MPLLWTPHIIRAFETDSPLVSPVTLVLNASNKKLYIWTKRMMIQRNSGQEIYIILDENKSLNTKKTTQNETK